MEDDNLKELQIKNDILLLKYLTRNLGCLPREEFKRAIYKELEDWSKKAYPFEQERLEKEKQELYKKFKLDGEE